MQVRLLVAAAAVLAVLAVAPQLAYTTVGQPVGSQWGAPTEVASVTTADGAVVREVVAAGGPDGGVVAWIVREDEDFRVSYARVTVDSGTVSLGDRRTVASGSTEVAGLDAAVGDGEVALAWERSFGNDVVLHRTSTGRTRVVSEDPLRVLEPSVALVRGTAVVAWQQWAGTGFTVEVAGVSDGAVEYATVPRGTSGTGSPSVNAVGDGFAVTYFAAGNQTVEVAFGSLGPDGPTAAAPRTLGSARPIGGFGGGTGPVSVDAAADGGSIRGVWLDRLQVSTAAVAAGGEPTAVSRFGRGDRPRVASDGDGWLAAWVVSGRETDNDLAFAAGGEDASDGTLSRFPSSANHPSPFYGPDPAVAWSERGAEMRVLVSGLQPGPTSRFADRLRAQPGRIAFVALAALVVGLVTLPIMPWIAVTTLLAFYLTNRFFRNLAVRVVTRVWGLLGGAGERPPVRERMESASPLVWGSAFVLAEVAVLVALLPSVGTTVPLRFAGPLAVSGAAWVGTVVVYAVSSHRSSWRVVGTFAYLQNVALWSTALPGIL